MNLLGWEMEIRKDVHRTQVTRMEDFQLRLMDLKERIERLKRKKRALILAHNYQRPEVQEIADVVGDSLELAIAAQNIDADIIVFCGVDFMAETAYVLNPDRKVLLPDIGAICPMAQMLNAEMIREARRAHPDAEVVLYVNTSAHAKALADCICTSANAPEIVNAMSSQNIIFGPDKNLSYFVRKRSDKRIITVPEYGMCPTHHQISLEDLMAARASHPYAEVVVHPECVPEVQENADFIASTSGMLRYCSKSSASEFVIGTEIGLIYRLKKQNPSKKFYPISENAVCPQMKMHSLPKIEAALEREKPVVSVPEDVAADARMAIERMISHR